MNKLFKVLTVLCAVCLLFCSCSQQETALEPTEEFFVNDFAGVLTSADHKTIYNQGVNLYEACKSQVVVVTVKSLGGEEIEDYSYDLANRWGIGDKDEDSGILLLLSVKDRKVRIEVGSGLEGAITDGKTGRILDKYGVNYFKNDEFSKGLTAVYNSIVNEIYIEYNLTPVDKSYTSVDLDEDLSDTEMPPVAVIIVVFIMIFIVGALTRFGGFGGGFSGGGGGFSGGGGSRGF